ncbi:Uncharacterized protein Rs2_30826 [Raphanus sativus]|uniref:Uncharacterized protein LOC108809448 n=1 Tax=Raphanus sativus TaxID=3726 RepID=A0A6J0JN45_RAPSA|nr:uncharacterized protein LOC108809448 [Raphanus sativus]KAJ4891078.1 Uncharacterized protein Rs2_30826 [Raphanus sativus]
MDSVDFDSVKAEKAKALRRYNSFLRVGRFFRAAEVCVAILFLFWTFSRLPFAVQISREFLLRIAGVVSSPLFVFLLGNCIVVLLLTKSSVEDNNGGSSAPNAETDDIYETLVRSVENRYKEKEEEDLLEEEEIVYDDKEVIVIDLMSSDIPHEEIDQSQTKVYGRSKSDVKQTSADDDHMVVIPKPSSLQRSKTEKCMRIIDDNNNNKNSYAEDNLSNEEFQKTIEAFIAKQLIFRRQESLSVVVHNKA